MRRTLWLGSAAAAVLLMVAAILGLRGTAPSQKPPAPAAAAVAPPAAKPAPSPAPSPIAPSFDIVRVDPRGQAVVAGRAAPGDRVRLLDGGASIGEVTADARGEWVLVPAAPLPPGDRQLSLETIGRDGGPPRHSGDIVALSVTPPASPGADRQTLAVLLPGDPTKPSKVLQRPAADGQKLSLDTAEYGAPGRLMLSGHATPGARLNVYAGDRLLGTVIADAAGGWSLSAAEREPAGGAELRLDELAADGTVARRIAVPFEAPGVSTPAAGSNYVVQRGNSLWLIARQTYGQGTRYTTIFSANRGQIQDPNKIYPGQLFKLPKS